MRVASIEGDFSSEITPTRRRAGAIETIVHRWKMFEVSYTKIRGDIE